MRALIALMIMLTLALPARAEIQTREIEYQHNNVRLKGFLAWDSEAQGSRPGVLVVHEWWGHNEFVRQRARQLAQAGYIAFALDMYGDGVLTDDPARAQQLATPFYQDRALMRSRAAAGLEVLRKHDNVDTDRLAVIGYCFGGTTALELARSGAELRCTVSFHGGLGTPNADDARAIRGFVLVLTGAADPLVPAQERTTFIEQMEEAGVDYQVIVYGKAKHSFTNPEADRHNLPPVAYDRSADEYSWAHMMVLFNRALDGREQR
jgi:dienelactone hydrolase